MKKRFVLLVLLLAIVMAYNCFGFAFAEDVAPAIDAGKEISTIKEAGQSCDVQGLVVAANTRGVVITDGKDGVMIYGSSILDVVALGDYIEIQATASEYNNILQLEYNSESVVTQLPKENAPTAPTTQALTAEIAQGWQDKANQTPSGLSVADVLPYSWTATATRVNNYWALTPDWAADLGFDIEPLYVNTSTFNLQAGVKYDVEGYFIGFNNTSSTPFAGMMLTKLTAVAGQVEVVVANEYLAQAYRSGLTISLGVSISPATEDQGYSVVSSDDEIATWNATDKVVNVLKAGTVTLTVTAAADITKTATITLVAYESEVSIGEIVNIGTYSILGTVVAKTTNAAIVQDDTGGIMVYDIKQVSDLTLGDEVIVSGTVSEYNGLLQFSYNPGVVVEKTGTAAVSTESVTLTETLLAGWQTTRSQADVKLYSWTAVAGLRNGYNIYSLTYDGIAVESEVALANIELGATYDIQGYFAGYNTGNHYASFVITSYVKSETQQDYLGFNRDEINLGIGSTYTLSPIVGGSITAADVVYSGYNTDIISVVDGVVTGLVGGDTTIIATAKDIEREIDVHVSTAISQVTTPNQFYTVIGKVVAKTTQSIVIHDGTDGILVYDRDAVAQYELGDVIQVSGYVSLFNNMLQFSYNGSLATSKLNDREITVLAAKTLTKEIADGWATLESPILPINCQEYTWTAKVGKSGNFFTINLDGSETVIEPAYLPDNFTLVEGETVTISGYFIGYSTNNKYAAIAITDVVHAQQ